MIIKIVSIGKFSKNSPMENIFESYKKRIENKVVLVEVRDEINKKKKLILQKSLFEKNISIKTNLVVLDKSGKNLSSEKFSSFLDEKMKSSCKELIFFIGGPEGFEYNLIKNYFNLSFGIQTWPHLLIRIMLVEQIYRALSIIKNHPYHK